MKARHLKPLLPVLALLTMGSTRTCTFSLEGIGELTDESDGGAADGGATPDGGAEVADGGDEVTFNSVSSSCPSFGRIYLTARQGAALPFNTSQGFATTSIDGPGSYWFNFGATVLTEGASVTVSAWMDTLGTGGYDAINDPFGSATGTYADGVLTIPSIALTCPDVAAEATTSISLVRPFEGGAVVVFDEIGDGMGHEVVSGYIVTATGTSGTMGTQNVFVATGSVPIAVFSNLTPGGHYNFSVSAVSNGTSFSATTYGSTVVISSPGTTGSTITGSLDLTDITFPGSNPSPVAVFVAMDQTDSSQVFVSAVPADGETDFTIHELTDGHTYGVFAFVDIDGDGEVGPLDVNLSVEATLAGGTAAVTFPAVSGDAIHWVHQTSVSTGFFGDFTNAHAEDPGTWFTAFYLTPGREMPVRATVASGPGWAAAQDFLFRSDMGQWSALSQSTLVDEDTATTPVEFTVSYSTDTSTWPGTSWPTSASHLEVFNVTPVIVDYVADVSVTCSGGTATISWTPPATAPSGDWHYQIDIANQPTGMSGMTGVWSGSALSTLDPSTTPVVASTAGLIDHNDYVLMLFVIDADGNSSRVVWNFSCE